ncbi:DUF305 domain-containing protein [Planobispora takensis]|uniref:DUF305 domain-containing protein n=1 Tax=Planobispora takensis TaxID=1367882 RepID=UPI001EF3B9C8|nr:DUF305 domain-containing protein [Planobispora takensis]
MPRLLMLVALVLGVAAMHTLGHLDHHQGYGAAPGHEGVHAPPAPPPTVAAGIEQEASGLGGALPRLDPTSVCLAVLPSLLLLLMAAVLLRTRHRRNTGVIGARPGARGARSSAAFNDADVAFAQMMIPHHRQAVEMAELAETRAADPEIRELAAKIKAAQDPEIATMTGWLTSWGAPVEPEGGHGGHDMPGMMTGQDMTALEEARGAAFDRMFAERMIAHHEGAVEMAETERAQGSDPEARRLAATVATAQQAEIEQMRRLLDRL